MEPLRSLCASPAADDVGPHQEYDGAYPGPHAARNDIPGVSDISSQESQGQPTLPNLSTLGLYIPSLAALLWFDMLRSPDSIRAVNDHIMRQGQPTPSPYPPVILGLSRSEPSGLHYLHAPAPRSGVLQHPHDARQLTKSVDDWMDGLPSFPSNNDGDGDGDRGFIEKRRDAIVTSSTDLDGGDKEPGPGAQDKDETQETHKECYWRNISRYLRTEQGSRPVVMCMICHEKEIVIRELQPRRDDGDQEEPCIFSCGHVVGATCWHKWGEFREGTRKDWRCPICNTLIYL